MKKLALFEQIFCKILRACAYTWSKNFAKKIPKKAIFSNKAHFERGLFFIFFTYSLSTVTAQQHSQYDIVVYGGSSAGVVAALQSARMGCSVALIVSGYHVGGMTSNGLSCVDATNASIIGGLTSEFFHRVWKYYQNSHSWIWEKPRCVEGQVKKSTIQGETMWVMEPHVAEHIFLDMLAEAHVPLFFGERIDRRTGVVKNERAISYIVMESGQSFSGKIFIDATYEGDLMASAGVSYTIGREANAVYDEQDNGIKPNLPLYHKIDPYVIQKKPSSGLLPRVFPNLGGIIGEGDRGIQAYNYRLCLTENPKNMCRIEKPKNYDEKQYELLFRAAEASKRSMQFLKLVYLPNKKYDSNHCGPISTDYVGKSWDYAEADYDKREKLALEHQLWQRGLIWTLQNHPRIPLQVRQTYSKLGLAKDEFIDNGYWPYDLYIREARRMVADFVITEKTALGVDDSSVHSIGLASYHLDSHAVKYYVDDRGLLRLEGGIFKKVPKPFPISYRSITPKSSECTNLFVPVCLSASHVAYSSIRMEPVFMILGQSAATAASFAVQLNIPVQDIPYSLLQLRLLCDGQILY